LNPTSSPTDATHLVPRSSDRPGDDPIFALNAEARRRAAEGEDVLNATLGALLQDDGRLAVMPSVFEAYRRVGPERAAAYAPIAGVPRFLEAVRRDLLGEGARPEGSAAVATPGGTGAVHHAIVNYLEPGQKLLTTSFFWGPYAILADHTGRGVATFETFDEAGAFHHAAFERALHQLLGEQGRALVVLNTPCHNPTGYSLDDAEWTRIADVVEAAAADAPVSVLLDFAYAKFAPPGSLVWQPHMERIARRAGALVAWTASKSFAQYGARIGALVALTPDAEERARVQNALAYSCRGTWSNCNHWGMEAVAELLEDPELRGRSEAEREVLRTLLGERVELFNRCAAGADLRYPRYEGGFFVTVFTSEPEVTAERMRAEGVFVVPVRGAVRVALCSTPKAQVPRLVESLARALRSD